MKKLLSLLLIVLTLACTLTIVSCDYEVPDDLQSTDPNSFIFKNVSGGLCVEGLKDTCKDSEIIIPSYVKQGNKNKKVVEIAAKAFENNSYVTKIAVPGTVKEIGANAFANCPYLKEVYLDKGVQRLRQSILYNSYAKIFFNGTSKEFKQINTGGVRSSWFYDKSETNKEFYVYCTDLILIYNCTAGMNPREEYYEKASTGLDYTLNADGNSYSVRGIGTCTDTDIIIPSQFNGKPVTSIGGWAFASCSSLASVDIPDSVTTIGDYAFAWRSSLISVVIGDSVTSIGKGAFAYCNLDTIVCNSPNYYVEGGCLIEGTKVIAGTNNSVIPEGITVIDDYAFSGRNKLTSIIIPDSVTSIGFSAFSNCQCLTSVEIPDSVTSIDDWAFNNTAYYNDDNNWVDGVLYIGNHLIKSRDTISGEYVVKDGTITIASFAFNHCDSLTSVVIPNSITNINNYAFNFCFSLTDVYYNGTSKMWDNIYISFDGVCIDAGVTERSNDSLIDATRYYYSETKPTTSGNFWHWVGGKPVAW